MKQIKTGSSCIMYSVNQVIKDNCTKIFAQNNCWVTNSKVNVQMISRPVADHSSVCQGSRSPPTISPTPWKPLFPFVTFFFVSLLLICHSPALPITYCLLPIAYCLAFWRWLFSLARKRFVRDLMSPALVQFANWPQNFFNKPSNAFANVQSRRKCCKGKVVYEEGT